MIIEIKKKENENQEQHEDKKTLNERIEDLVNSMERTNTVIKRSFSWKSAFLRGMLQGLGFVIGTTILAGLAYSLSVRFLGKDFVDGMTLEQVIKKENNR